MVPNAWVPRGCRAMTSLPVISNTSATTSSVAKTLGDKITVL